MNPLIKFSPCILLAATATVSCNQAQEKKSPPNIVFIMVDDLGWTDAGYMGSEYYETPHIDQLARNGMIFMQAYANAPNCAPTRACFLTGQYGPRHGVYTVGRSDRGESKTRRLIPTENTRAVSLEHIMIPEALKARNYRSIELGKWHVGNTPEQQGFDVGISRSAFRPHFNEEGEYLADFLTDKAIEFIKDNNPEKTGDPFFVYLEHLAVHTPIEAPENIISRYKEKPGVGCHNDPVYAAMIESVDLNLAKMVGALEELGLAENTLVIFFSDNGGHGAYTCMDPLRGGKGMFYEGGIRVPMFAYWSGTIKPGTICEEPVISTDFYPTFLELAGADAPNNYVLDGTSLVPLLHGAQTLDRESIFWHFPAYLQSYGALKDHSRDTTFRTRPVSVIRKGDYKLLQFHEEWSLDGGREKVPGNNAVELYNLAADIGETNNLAATETAKRDELLDELIKWQQNINAPIPSESNPEYEK